MAEDGPAAKRPCPDDRRNPLSVDPALSFLAARDQEEWNATYETLKADVLTDLAELGMDAPECSRIGKMMDYTVPGGKLMRGRLVFDTLEEMMTNSRTAAAPVSSEHDRKRMLARVLGWCVELLQGCFLVVDDVMDQSITRRGKPCWYKLPEVGPAAINDGCILRSAIFRILRKYFGSSSYYVSLVELFNEVILQTELGQMMDSIPHPTNGLDFSRFNVSNYRQIVRFKTAYYSFYLPIRLGLILSEAPSTPEAHATTLRLSLALGELFQVQDDFLDLYQDPDVLGKIGTDIEDAKCSWLLVTALAGASPEQRDMLREHYGKSGHSHGAAVRLVYDSLGLPEIFARHENEAHASICATIDSAPPGVPVRIFRSVLQVIFRRQK
eukprot:gnl/Spiro4/22579_TR11137_c0_g1_i1.p1 gnl/Spiro4/22579_TR11137_c0_g1~~gnl/Spiro4/22579_TR11137_c0_g1_i1.p1  ORF type:complete len:383 (+),score=37.67 gnl/Spiro4/22579_TR11137_c0_g1_i1:87-1235(+)